ncbi:MAG: sugar phosphate isomerase/epimerase [Thermoplasmata archaeon]|nr:sugar phosphate isomerase/epimerase [Thermoplasmata archaeon]
MLGVSCPPLCYLPVEEVIEKIAENFKLWEIIAEHNHHPENSCGKLKTLLPSYSLKMQVHAPLSDINIASISQRVREASIKEVKEAIIFARQIDSSIVTIHPGHKSPMTSEHVEIVYSLTSEAIREVEKFGEEMGVRIALENMPEMSVTICKKPDEILQVIRGTEIGICFDVGHANTTSTVEEFFNIKHLFLNVHLHDNDGKKDLHSTVGEGSIKFKPLCSKFNKYKGNYIIESRTIESAVRSRNLLGTMGYG